MLATISVLAILLFSKCTEEITNNEPLKTEKAVTLKKSERDNLTKKLSLALAEALEEELTYMNRQAYGHLGSISTPDYYVDKVRNRDDGTWTVKFYAFAGYEYVTNQEDYIDKIGFYFSSSTIMKTVWVKEGGFPQPNPTTQYAENYNYTYTGLANNSSLYVSPYLEYHTSVSSTKRYRGGAADEITLSGPEIYTFNISPYSYYNSSNGKTYTYYYYTVDGSRTTQTSFRWDANTAHTIVADEKFTLIISDEQPPRALPLRFDHWNDGNTNRSRTITFNGNISLQAVYVTDIAY